MSIGDSIALVENAIRRLIEDVLRAHHGADWMNHLGVTDDRLRKWHERHSEAQRLAVGTVTEERILFYSDFTDLWKIMSRPSNWPLFEPCFRNKRRLEVYLGRLSELRNPASHSRSLVPYEESLVEGLSGELRQMITIFRNSGGTGPEPEHFARIEQITDSYGHRGIGRASQEQVVDTRDTLTLRPGDRVQFTGTARDPRSRAIHWTIRTLFGDHSTHYLGVVRGETFEVEWCVNESDIHDQQEVDFLLKSDSGPHRYGDHDDNFRLLYRVLPQH